MPSIALTWGDPAGIGPEVALKSLALTQKKEMGRASGVFVADAGWLKTLARRLGIRFIWPVVQQPNFARPGWQIWDAVSVPKDLRLGTIQPSAGKAALASLDRGIGLALSHCVDAVVTAPVSKAAISLTRKHWVGHTEHLAAACGRNTEPIMMFYARPFSVSLVTTHESIQDALHHLTPARVERVITRTVEALMADFGFSKVRVAVAGINPHAGEGGLLGLEEKRWLAPLVGRLSKKLRVSLAGPLSPDSVFLQAKQGEFDLVVAMFHDQGLIPMKLLAWDRAVHVTLGLPFVRTSPTHGTAFDRAGKGTSDPRPMVEAIRLALTMSQRRIDADRR